MAHIVTHASITTGTACRLAAISLLAVAVVFAGCTSVAPWERGTLAKPQMAVEPMPLRSALRAHVHGSRQAASMGGAADGGGCGCY